MFVLLIVVRIVGKRETIKVVQEFLSWKNQHSWSQSLLAFEFDETDVSLCHEIEIDIGSVTVDFSTQSLYNTA